MTSNALRHPVLIAGVVAALGVGTVAPAAMAASTPAPQVAPQGLGGLLGGLLTTVTAPVVDLVTPLVTSTGVLPAVLPAATVDALTNALTGTVDTLVPADVASLLTALTPAQVQQLAADPTAVAPLLAGLLPMLTGLAGTSAPSADAVTTALGQLTAILSGGLPTTDVGLATLTGLLNQATTLLGLPSVASLPVVGPLIVQLGLSGSGLPDGPAKTAVVSAVTATGGALGLTPAQIASILSALGLRAVPASTTATPKPTSTATPTAATVARARIVSARISKDRRKVTLRIACPATAPAAGCKVRPSVKVGGRVAKVASSATIRRGAARTITAKVPAAVAKKVRRAGGRLVVRLTTTGSTAGAVSKTVKVRRAA